jgi:branched-chain amino acid transport system permease protein
MMMQGKNLARRWDLVALGLLAIYPLLCALAGSHLPDWLRQGDQISNLFIFSILALGLNVAVGYTGLLQLGIAAFFGIGAYITGILTVPSYPFQTGIAIALVMSTAGAAIFGLILGAPTLRLRGDYLALVTLGFGEVVKVTLRNLEQITAGTKGLNPIPQPSIPSWLTGTAEWLGLDGGDYRLMYYLSLAILVVVVVLLANLEKSRLGRAWVAIREDELAATCMGINATRAKLASFAVSAALAGMAGSLYATKLTSTADPNTYDFSRSIIILCCVILGGLGSLRGTILGVFLLLGFDNIISPLLDDWIQNTGIATSATRWLRSMTTEGSSLPAVAERLLKFSNWRLMIFGLALVIMMRLRPEGIIPSLRMQHELHPGDQRARAPA